MRSVLRFEAIERALLVLCLCLALGLTLIVARKSDLGALNQQLANDIVKANLRSVIVVDFQDSLGKPSTLGWYLAEDLSESWLSKKQKFRVLDRSELNDTRVEPEDLTSEMVKRLGSVWGVDATITGAVETSPEHYVLSATVRRVADNTTIAIESLSVPHSRVLDVLKPLPEFNSGIFRISHAGTNGIDAPRCIACPIPAYSDRARAGKIQGTIVLSVLVSENGRADTIAIVKGLGFGLTQKAIETVSEWRFKPATSKEGEPVPVIAPIEVTFRLN
jgi:TonB family protein